MPSDKDLEPGFQRFDFRFGLTARSPKGMNRQSDPGALGAEEFYLLQNARINGNQIIERPGLVKAIDTPLNGAIVGLWDAGIVDYRPKLYLDNEGSGGLTIYNESQNPTVQKTSGGTSVQYLHCLHNQNEPIASVGDVSDVTLYKGLYYSATASGGEYNPTLVSTITGFTNFRGPGLQSGGLLFLQKHESSTKGIYEHNLATSATALVDSYSGSGDADYREKLAQLNGEVFYVQNPSSTTKTVRKRSTAGTWSTVGTITTFSAASLVNGPVYFPAANKLYVAADKISGNGDLLIYSVDSSAVTLVRTIALATGDTRIWSMHVFNGYLYFLYYSLGESELRLGRFDGSTWTDNHAVPTTPPGGAPSNVKYEMFSVGTELFLLESNVSGGSRLLRSDDTDTTTWTVELSGNNDFSWHGDVVLVT